MINQDPRDYEATWHEKIRRERIEREIKQHEEELLRREKEERGNGQIPQKTCDC